MTLFMPTAIGLVLFVVLLYAGRGYWAWVSLVAVSLSAWFAAGGSAGAVAAGALRDAVDERTVIELAPTADLTMRCADSSSTFEISPTARSSKRTCVIRSSTMTSPASAAGCSSPTT